MKIHKNLPDHRVILGCTRDAQIHTGASAFQLMASGLQDKIIDKAVAKFMVAADAGQSWQLLLDSQPIFGLDENDTPCFVEGGFAVPKVPESGLKPKKKK